MNAVKAWPVWLSQVLATLSLRSKAATGISVFTAIEPQAIAWLQGRMNPGTHRHLPRLVNEAYRGRQFVHWTMAVAGRQTGWLKPDFHSSFLNILRKNVDSYGVVLPAYCLMPDHLHLLAAGRSSRSDQLRWSRAIRRCINEALSPFHLQKQAYDHILRPTESGPDAFAAQASYISANPVRAGLAASAKDWAYVGSVVPEIPELDPRHADFHERWWAYWNARES